jgi:hypothetical protein
MFKLAKGFPASFVNTLHKGCCVIYRFMLSMLSEDMFIGHTVLAELFVFFYKCVRTY